MEFPAWTIIPFVCMLGAIAVAPLVPAVAHHWEKPRNQLIYALALGIPVAIGVLAVGKWDLVVHALVEYGQFICLLLALFVVSGGIVLRGDIAATPRTNTLFLALGGVLASFIGTTGAAMLLIRPILRTNSEREHRAHTVVFTIFIVANCGGLLTPLGDPPLFLGMLRGVPFTWTFHLVWEWMFVVGLLLISYWALDRKMYAKETSEHLVDEATHIEPIRLAGAVNLIWFVVIIGAVAKIPSVDAHVLTHGHEGGAPTMWWEFVPWRELVMLAAAGASVVFGRKEIRDENEFEMGPIKEVGALFIGIFLTMIPALAVVRSIAPSLHLDQVTVFLFTGGLSAVLDNAPTYVTFFEMSRTLADQFPGEPLVAGVPEVMLVSISLAAVFCGALTYIGNGPNFMVKSVAESQGVAMPSFGGYIRESMWHLAPILAAMVCLFIAEGRWTGIIGGAIIALIAARAVLNARSPQPLVGPLP